MSFDNLAILVFILTQCRITQLWMQAARRRWSGRMLFAARAAIVAFDLLLAFGCLCSSSAFDGPGGIPARLASPLGAATLIYVGIAATAVVVRELTRLISSRFDVATDPTRRRIVHTAGGALLAAPFAAIGYGTLIGRSDFQIREVEIPIPNLPPDLEGLRILQLSDIHLSAFLSEAELESVVDATAGLHPHLAVVTGDLISSYGDPIDACIRQLARVRAEAGVLGCLGNHERYAAAEDYTTRAAARVGIQFLRRQARQLRFGSSVLNVAGVDYQALKNKKQYLYGAERMVVPGAANLLLSHNPDVFPVAARQGYNLMLAGHTHGGQVTVEILDQSFSAARFLTPYVYGLYREGSASAYVTRGIGTIGIPARIGAPPEISLLRLRKA